MAFFQPIRRDLAGGGAGGVGQGRDMSFQRIRERLRIDQALREKQQHVAGTDRIGFPSDFGRKMFRIGLA